MRSYKIHILIYVVLILLNVLLHLYIRSAQQNDPHTNTANSGIFEATAFLVSWLITALVSVSLFLQIIAGIIERKYSFDYSLFIIVLLAILTFFCPILLVNYL